MPKGITDTPCASSAFASKTDSTEHLERLRQKLHQLRSLPSTSRDFGDQSVAVSIESPPPATSSEADLDQDELLDIIYERRSPSSATTSKEKSRKPFELQFLGWLKLIVNFYQCNLINTLSVFSETMELKNFQKNGI